MAVTPEEVEREKQTLPFGWGRFGKAIEHVASIVSPQESLLASCVTLNPSYEYKPRGIPGGLVNLGSALHELTKTTNVVLAATTTRVLAIGTGAGGAPRDHVVLPYDGLSIVSREKRAFVLGWPDGEMRFRGAAKQQLPRFLDVISAQARPAGVGAASESESADGRSGPYWRSDT